MKLLQANLLEDEGPQGTGLFIPSHSHPRPTSSIDLLVTNRGMNISN